MPNGKARGYASWDPRGFYHYHERPGGPFISSERFLSMLRPSIAGYHGFAGRFIPYGAIAQILGSGMPTGRHVWWKATTELPVPTRSYGRQFGVQYQIELTVMNQEGEVTTHRLYTPIGKGYSVERGEQMIAEFLSIGTGSPPIELEPGEELFEIGRTFTEIDWHSTWGVGPLEE